MALWLSSLSVRTASWGSGDLSGCAGAVSTMVIDRRRDPTPVGRCPPSTWHSWSGFSDWVGHGSTLSGAACFVRNRFAILFAIGLSGCAGSEPAEWSGAVEPMDFWFT